MVRVVASRSSHLTLAATAPFPPAPIAYSCTLGFATPARSPIQPRRVLTGKTRFISPQTAAAISATRSAGLAVAAYGPGIASPTVATAAIGTFGAVPDGIAARATATLSAQTTLAATATISPTFVASRRAFCADSPARTASEPHEPHGALFSGAALAAAHFVAAMGAAKSINFATTTLRYAVPAGALVAAVGSSPATGGGTFIAGFSRTTSSLDPDVPAATASFVISTVHTAHCPTLIGVCAATGRCAGLPAVISATKAPAHTATTGLATRAVCCSAAAARRTADSFCTAASGCTAQSTTICATASMPTNFTAGPFTGTAPFPAFASTHAALATGKPTATESITRSTPFATLVAPTSNATACAVTSGPARNPAN